jgi:hypothetical protein
MPVDDGTSFGPYLILAKLGEGGQPPLASERLSDLPHARA